MKSIFVGHFRPTTDEFFQLWEDCIFAVDANVLLNLYRYSSTTRKELEKALNNVKDRVFIPHQAAKEFLKNRLSVTAGQASEYTKAIKTINELLTTLSTKNRHPFLPDSELPKLKNYSEKLIIILESQRDTLLAKLTEDEILDFVEKLFEGKTGQPFDKERMAEISKEGEDRYQEEVPPGYKDSKKDDGADPYRKYGDLVVWFQIIEYAKSQKKPLIFITDDKKEDWWLEQSGRTIGPRPEIIEEFITKSEQKFWMYTVDKFIQESAKISNSDISEDVITEIRKISMESKKELQSDGPSIEVSQEVYDVNSYKQEGLLIISLNRPMKYATGTGKFSPRFSDIPRLEVEFADSPYEDHNVVGISYGCGTTRDFNIHLRAKRGLLEPGDYVVKYTAHTKETGEDSIPTEG